MLHLQLLWQQQHVLPHVKHVFSDVRGFVGVAYVADVDHREVVEEGEDEEG